MPEKTSSYRILALMLQRIHLIPGIHSHRLPDRL